MEISSIGSAPAASGMSMSWSIAGACWSFAGACLSMTPAGLVSVNSTESATDGVENSDAEEEALEGMPVSMASILADQALKASILAGIALDGTTVFSTGAGFRASSPEMCTGLILDVLSAACLLEVAPAPFERLCCSILQSVKASSSSVACSSVALACEHKQCNQTRKRTCMGAAAGTLETVSADSALETPLPAPLMLITRISSILLIM